MKRALTMGVAVLAASGGAVGWVIARRLTAPSGPRNFELVIRDVELDGGRTSIVLDRTRHTVAKGIYNLWFANGAWAQLSDEVLDRGSARIARHVTGASPGFSPSAGARASWSGIYFASPADAGLRAREVMIDTPVGSAPAWLVEGEGAGEDARYTWAIHIHGLGSTRAGTLRGAQVAGTLGYTSLVISYRNDGEGPKVGSGRSSLGLTEVEDVEAALHYAVQHGAQRIVLFGWSMGATIVLQLVAHSRFQGPVVGVVLESPVLDWVATIKANCVRRGLPAATGLLATPWLALSPLSRLVGLPANIPLGELDWLARAAELTVPTLIIHGILDDSAPTRVSQELRDLRPDLVELKVVDSAHTMSWNSGPSRWKSTVTNWLVTHVDKESVGKRLLKLPPIDGVWW